MSTRIAQFEVTANTDRLPRSMAEIAAGKTPTVTFIQVASVQRGETFEWEEDFLGEDLNRAVRLFRHGAVIVEAPQSNFYTHDGRMEIARIALKQFSSPLQVNRL